MADKPSIAIVGAGKLGTDLALALPRVGYRIVEIITRSPVDTARLARRVHARCCTMAEANLGADVTWLCVPDREIRKCAQSLSARRSWKQKTVLHSSGALASDELKPLRRKGAYTASLHPFMTFVEGSLPSLKGVPFAVEGDRVAVRVASRIARDLGGRVFTITREEKPAYHAWGSFASPLLVSLFMTAEEVAAIAGIAPSQGRRRMLPILQQTLANYAKVGGVRAFTGPLIRGDTSTVRKHLRVLQRLPRAREVYLALVRSAIHNLPIGRRAQWEELLEEV